MGVFNVQNKVQSMDFSIVISNVSDLFNICFIQKNSIFITKCHIFRYRNCSVSGNISTVKNLTKSWMKKKIISMVGNSSFKNCSPLYWRLIAIFLAIMDTIALSDRWNGTNQYFHVEFRFWDQNYNEYLQNIINIFHVQSCLWIWLFLNVMSGLCFISRTRIVYDVDSLDL